MDTRPRKKDGYSFWQEVRQDVTVCFSGRGPRKDRQSALAALVPDGIESSWLRQVHSAKVSTACPGCAGEGDALVTRRRRLALVISTADCVPVLLARDGPGEALAAAHAGWRGIAAGIVPATVERLLDEDGDASRLTAWIGPAIGPCCYEVGEEVAERVCKASSADVAVPGPGSRPHLDLQRAVLVQLRRAGVDRVRLLERCTFCDAAHLSSYRREGEAAGRNLAILFRA